ncbi:N-acetylmuramoyl-L-alanine amidase [Rhodoblastus acidophilus]|uniref:N-acetylmuramoyl-L-alanine amidase family protein n=1 Tax=Rhodoblastus acidophilus TaxID=1074 RepID=UPI00222505A7|nr:N-acetylmuramoyl-L-alanine amidase [Rhodoblastus acidophilus]MCW2283142.1 N-acetylmuramoyl-L-alanine amidase [Rhodoblastus acidophilus]MCW2331807.1 N-acetylmuramoyl-L-alanine amidase [Rhodoblastus acidophilus]
MQNNPPVFRKSSLWSAALAALMLLVASPARAEPPAAFDVRVENPDGAGGRETRLIFSLDACVPSQAYVLDQPPRAVLDLPEVKFLIDPSHGDPASAKHKSRRAAKNAGKPAAPHELTYRFGRLSAGKSRIIVDLPGPAQFSAACAPKNAGGELTLVIKPAEPAAFHAAARAGAETQDQARRDATAAIPARAPDSQSDASKPLIVLDPGHGGVDAGTIQGDVAEKDVVLEFAKALAGPLRASGRYRIAFTREDDAFIPLQERVRIARKLGAALFVSLHADSLSSGAQAVRGATVYTVSDRASDAEAARVAASENQADSLAGQEQQEQAGDVNDILFDLTRRETRAYSNIFAKYLSERWKIAATLNKNPQRHAGFVVLKAPDVPSVLLELGYLSSEQDAADLTSPKWREKAAAQAALAIDDFFRGRPTVAAPALNEPPRTP